MKKQYNYYMDVECKYMLEFIKMQNAQISMLNDSQLVEYLIRQSATALGYVKKESE